MFTSMHISVDDASFCDGPKMHIPKVKMPCISLIVNCFVNTVNTFNQLNKANSSDTEALIVLNTLRPFKYCNHLEGEEIAGCFA